MCICVLMCHEELSIYMSIYIYIYIYILVQIYHHFGGVSEPVLWEFSYCCGNLKSHTGNLIPMTVKCFALNDNNIFRNVSTNILHVSDIATGYKF